ncbi:MAG: bifunctional (p)ppGpp synthetase/guanosine-3',5'-bis(diphosphate) 3'-pyrophosphohydrolase [Eubacteriales bacterium]|nr:bifunctional (p)ppGpp synthetase/guanosine-3',5'-bis(diphosphate) 3'-pyrophosphohydrolase [Eubacteriales bacterium]
MADITNEQIEQLEQKVMSTSEHIRKMDDFVSPEILYDELINCVRKYHPSDDISMIEKAFRIANDAHKGQVRKSGEAYIIHPLCVAIILAELELDKETIVAGLLHDVVEDTVMTDEEIAREFNGEVALLVDGVTKLGQLSYDADKVEIQAENLRKMFLAMAKDIRVILIKLADRLHNMRTLKYMKPEKQREKARETMDIYAPIAQRLGISKIKTELDDLSLKYLEPEAYYDLVEKIAMRKGARDEYVQNLVEEVKHHIKDAGIEATIDGRSKHFFSIYKKMVNQGKTIDQIYDLFAIRILVNDVKDCYAALGVIHEMYKPIPGRFKDYIAMPKPNMYQSLHTTVIGKSGEPFEIQIRTYEMHRVAEYGIAAHWKYKEGNTDGKQNSDDMKLAWLRQTLEWQKEMKDPKEFMESLKMDLFSSQVFVFTPKGEVITLPVGSTPLDFAFKIHTEVGCHCVGAKVNGRMVTIDHKLNNGDIVEIVTSQNASGPSIDWLKIVVSTTAKTKIKQWLKRQNSSSDVAKGKDALEKFIHKKGYESKEIIRANYLSDAVKKLGYLDLNEAYKLISQGGTVLSKFAGVLIDDFEEEQAKEQKRRLEKEKALLEKNGDSAPKTGKRFGDSDDVGVIVPGMKNLLIRMGRCCSPVPGDDIVGFITKGRGITVHRKDCPNIISLSDTEKARLIDVEWERPKEGTFFSAEIVLVCRDRKGLFADISKACEAMDINIEALDGRPGKNEDFLFHLTLSINDTEQMKKVCRILKTIPSVMDVYRA